MDLATFVKETLVDIARGVAAANVEMNGGDKQAGDDGRQTYFVMHGRGTSQRLEFDMAVTEEVSRVKFSVALDWNIT